MIYALFEKMAIPLFFFDELEFDPNVFKKVKRILRKEGR